MLHGKSKPVLHERKFSFLADFLILLSVVAVIYGLITAISPWFGPVEEEVEISLSPEALPAYAGYSLLRMIIAYALSLCFAIVYGYIAAYC